MVFHWSLSESKSPQVSRTLLSILSDLNNIVVWIVSTHPLISKSFIPCTNPLVTLLSTPITIGISITVVIIIYSLRVFLHQFSLMAFHWSLSDSKYPQVSRTLLSILAAFNYAVV